MLQTIHLISLQIIYFGGVALGLQTKYELNPNIYLIHLGYANFTSIEL